MVLLELTLSSLLPLATLSTDKTQCYFHLSFNSTLQLINDISNGPQKLLRYFNDTAIVAFFRISLPWFGTSWATVFFNNLTF